MKQPIKIGFSIHAAAIACDLKFHQIKRAIAAGELVPRAVGTRSILPEDELRAWLRERPHTKTRRPRKCPTIESQSTLSAHR